MHVFKDPNITQWTNAALCGVTGISSYNKKTPIDAGCSLSNFQNYMNGIASYLPFSFDHAVAIMPTTLVIIKAFKLMFKRFFILFNSLDIWDSDKTAANAKRASVVGISNIARICSDSRYSIIEYSGLNSIQNAAHELGHR